ncbi:MAG: dimethylsulfonioproprionate lyase family protein [Roseovarius sp.]|nr:dimethylsulfonioproprionate lyase family protein [Roseovarius sp.]
MDPRWRKLLDHMRHVHAIPELSKFCELPPNPSIREFNPRHAKAADAMCADTGLATDTFPEFRDLIVFCSPLARWRKTYRDTAIGADFLDRFGCYEIVGADGPFVCGCMRGFAVYASAGLHYPWHHHPAEELYLVVAGTAEFAVKGKPSRTLRPGESVFHESNQPHSMTTFDKPVMAYVMWRGEIDAPPAWTYPEEIA